MPGERHTAEQIVRRLRETQIPAIHRARVRGMRQVANSLAHEINNPVAAAGANLWFMKENLGDVRARIAAASPNAVDALRAGEVRGGDPRVTATKSEPAAGLGLDCAYRAVPRHGGTIRLDGKPGEGTTATVVLPVRARAAAPAEVP